MVKAGGYVLYLTTERKSVFEETIAEEETFSQPVTEFAHTRSAPLICFVVLNGTHITHVARGRRGIVSGTELRRLNLQESHRLITAVPILEDINALDSRTKSKATLVFEKGGLFTPKAFESAIDAVSKVSEECRPLLQRFSRLRRELIAGLNEQTRRALGEQKEAVLSAVAIAGLERRDLHDWSPPSKGAPTSFLDGLPSAVMREDPMIINDLMNVPSFDLIRTLPYSAAVFEGGGKRLTVLLANRLPLEKLTGTDLIYFNEHHRSFVMVQYKAMESASGTTHFRLPNKDLNKEIDRMRSIEAQLKAIPIDESKENYRLNSGAFYIKLCARSQFNPDDIKLFPGMYFALDHWLRIASDTSLTGPLRGRLVTNENAGRYIDNDFFIKLVANAWIGTHLEQSAALEVAIRNTLESGKAIALAVESVSRQ
jgi:hypothetical protein